MYRREVPKLNKKIFSTWKSRMILYLSGIGESVLNLLDNDSTPSSFGPMTVYQMREKKEHNLVMIEIDSSPTNIENDVKDYVNSKEMWERLTLIYGGDQHVQKSKVDSLKGKYDEMRMKDEENITQYSFRIKEFVSVVKGVGGTLTNEEVVSKILRTLSSQYVIWVSSIQELGSILNNVLTLETLIGKLTAFELSNYDNSLPTIETAFKSSLNIGTSRKDKEIHSSSCGSDYDSILTEEREQEELEALLAKRLPRGKGKYKGKLPLKFFNCNVICHIASRCLDNDRNEKSDKKEN